MLLPKALRAIADPPQNAFHIPYGIHRTATDDIDAVVGNQSAFRGVGVGRRDGQAVVVQACLIDPRIEPPMELCTAALSSDMLPELSMTTRMSVRCV